MSDLRVDVERVRAVVPVRVEGEYEVAAVFAWAGVSVRLWKGGDPSRCDSSCMLSHRCGKTSRYFGLYSKAAVEGFLADLARGVGVVEALTARAG